MKYFTQIWLGWVVILAQAAALYAVDCPDGTSVQTTYCRENCDCHERCTGQTSCEDPYPDDLVYPLTQDFGMRGAKILAGCKENIPDQIKLIFFSPYKRSILNAQREAAMTRVRDWSEEHPQSVFRIYRTYTG